jgi:hypothetical protein
MQKKKRKTTPNQRGIFGALQTNVVLPKNTRNSIDHQKMGTWENHPKSNIITYIKSTQKTLQHSLF